MLKSDVFNRFARVMVENKYGKINLYQKQNLFFIQRHKGNTPPHKINYLAYIQALADMGVKKILSVNSVGSLKKKIKPGSLLVPDDFISVWNTPTFFDKEIKHITPNFCEDLRTVLYKTVRQLGFRVYDGGIYLQTPGPRLETPAEIKMFSKFADVVGMTLGSEVTLANEKNINFAAICMIDNYANGLVGTMDYDKIKEGAAKNLSKIEKILRIFLRKYES